MPKPNPYYRQPGRTERIAEVMEYAKERGSVWGQYLQSPAFNPKVYHHAVAMAQAAAPPTNPKRQITMAEDSRGLFDWDAWRLRQIAECEDLLRKVEAIRERYGVLRSDGQAVERKSEKSNERRITHRRRSP